MVFCAIYCVMLLAVDAARLEGPTSTLYFHGIAKLTGTTVSISV